MIVAGCLLETVGADGVSAWEQVGQVEGRAEPVGAKRALKIINMECLHHR